MITDPIHEERATFKMPEYAESAAPHEVLGELIEYLAEYRDLNKTEINQSGDGFTLYHNGPVGNALAFVSIQPGRFFADPTVKNSIEQKSPPIVQERLLDGKVEKVSENNNFSSSFRVVGPLGPTLTPPQIDIILASFNAIDQKEPKYCRR
jgi:hypothetical protein